MEHCPAIASIKRRLCPVAKWRRGESTHPRFRLWNRHTQASHSACKKCVRSAPGSMGALTYPRQPIDKRDKEEATIDEIPHLLLFLGFSMLLSVYH